MTYKKTYFRKEIEVENLITFYYYELRKDYHYKGQKHDFWEFIYVDKGKAILTFNQLEEEIKQGHMVLHRPLDFHGLRGTGNEEAHVMIFTFESHSNVLYTVADRQVRLTLKERNILKEIYKLASEVFVGCKDEDGAIGLKRSIPEPFGAEQLLKSYIEILFLLIIRQSKEQIGEKSLIKDSIDEDSFIKEIKQYMRSQLHKKMTSSHLCSTYGISRTKLYYLFKKYEGVGVKDYFLNLRLQHAKELLRANQFTISEIAEQLGFNSVHHFSKQFKEKSGVTPTDYIKSIKYDKFN